MPMMNRAFNRSVIFAAVVFAVATVACAFLDWRCALICLAAGILSVLLYIGYTQKRYREIVKLNDYLSRVCAGFYDLDVQDNAEGELSVLKNNLYKIMLLLQSQNDALRKDKTYLAASLADISHQLKTPLTSITMMCDLLKTETDAQKRRQFTDIIESQAAKMNWLIITLLKISKLDAGTAEFHTDAVSVCTVLKKAAEPFLVTADLRNITLDFSGVSDFTFCGDENWTIEAVGNILKNCLEHMGDGGKLTVSTAQTAVYDLLRIEDDGCGIPPADLPHIFERFYHGKNAAEDSVGIGLALSKTVLNREHAKIEATSTEGVGTAFTIRFYKTVV